MTFKLITTQGELPDYIEDRIAQAHLDDRRQQEQKRKRLEGGEHCFRDASQWYRLCLGYTNPYNLFSCHAELSLLETHSTANPRDPLIQAIRDRHLVFYGIGAGDTEMVFVDWKIHTSAGASFITGIDVNREFLEAFVVALRNKAIEAYPKGWIPSACLYFSGYHALFDQIVQQDLCYQNVHILLGSTLGNFYNQDQIIDVFSQRALRGDAFIIGVQLSKHIDILFQKYSHNPYYEDFILNYIPKSERKKVVWSMDQATGVISASHDGVEVFRSKKYDPMVLIETVERHGFKLLTQDIDDFENACIQAYQKI